MPKSSKQKLKLLYLMKILLEKTDDTHTLSIMQIIEELSRYDIRAERKSIYDDLEALSFYGLDVEVTREGKAYGYYIANRTFELPELKLLVDAVQSSKFITLKKSTELIHKIESLCSSHQARLLQRQVYVTNRIKAINESIYYNVDQIHSSIAQGSQISFQYFEYTVEKKRKFRRDGERYVVSPYALSWDDENYYLIAYDAAACRIKHYRVDKMVDICLTGEKRAGQDVFDQFDMAVYSRKMFGMYGGLEEVVTLEFENRLVGVVIDRFGKDISIIPTDAQHFMIRIHAAISPQFLAWIFGLGSGVKILHPGSVIEQMEKQLKEVSQLYFPELKS